MHAVIPVSPFCALKSMHVFRDRRLLLIIALLQKFLFRNSKFISKIINYTRENKKKKLSLQLPRAKKKTPVSQFCALKSMHACSYIPFLSSRKRNFFENRPGGQRVKRIYFYEAESIRGVKWK